MIPITSFTQLLPRKFNKFLITVGTPGQADLNGIMKLGPVGVRVEIEIKTGEAKQTPEQIFWMKMIRNMGGIYIVGRSESQVIEDLRAARLSKELEMMDYNDGELN